MHLCLHTCSHTCTHTHTHTHTHMHVPMNTYIYRQTHRDVNTHWNSETKIEKCSALFSVFQLLLLGLMLWIHCLVGLCLWWCSAPFKDTLFSFSLRLWLFVDSLWSTIYSYSSALFKNGIHCFSILNIWDTLFSFRLWYNVCFIWSYDVLLSPCEVMVHHLHYLSSGCTIVWCIVIIALCTLFQYMIHRFLNSDLFAPV